MEILKTNTEGMDWPMLYAGNPYIIQPGNVFFMHMILMDSDSNLAIIRMLCWNATLLKL